MTSERAAGPPAQAMAGERAMASERAAGLPAPEITGGRLTRASDRERECATEVLGDAYAVGRLELEEFLARTEAACSATTWGELWELTMDLPESGRLFGSGPGSQPRYESTRYCHPAKRPFLPLRVMAVIWLVIAAGVHVAAAIPLVLLALFVLRASRWE